MKHRLSGHFTPCTLSTAITTAALCFASVAPQSAMAATGATCYRLTPFEIGKVSIALHAAQTSADATTALTGFDPNSPSAYPNAEIRAAKAIWQIELDYLASIPAMYTQPFISAGNVALSLEQASIDMAYQLQHGRFWATAAAYNYSVTDPALTQHYMDTRKKIAAAIDAMQLVANLGSRCAVGQ
jgi:hypothetical protein